MKHYNFLNFHFRDNRFTEIVIMHNVLKGLAHERALARSNGFVCRLERRFSSYDPLRGILISTKGQKDRSVAYNLLH